MVFRSSRRIDFPMVDLAGIVYYPRYWDLAHVFFEEIWESLCGVSYPAVLKEKRLALPLVHSEATFHKPMIYGDVQIWILLVRNWTSQCGLEKAWTAFWNEIRV